MKNKVHGIALWCGILLIAVFSGCTKHDTKREAGKPVLNLPVIKPAPYISGVNFDGKQVTSEALNGKYWLASFMFTSCGDICPRLNSQISALFGEFKEYQDLKFVSISVDPENDTQEVLKKYAERYGAKPDKWYFLRMPIDTVKNLSLEGFRIATLDAPLSHSKRIVLVDNAGQIRGYYDGLEREDVEKLRQVLHSILPPNK